MAGKAPSEGGNNSHRPVTSIACLLRASVCHQPHTRKPQRLTPQRNEAGAPPPPLVYGKKRREQSWDASQYPLHLALAPPSGFPHSSSGRAKVNLRRGCGYRKERRRRARNAPAQSAGRRGQPGPGSGPCRTTVAPLLRAAPVEHCVAALRPTDSTMLKKFDKKDEESGEGARPGSEGGRTPTRRAFLLVLCPDPKAEAQ